MLCSRMAATSLKNDSLTQRQISDLLKSAVTQLKDGSELCSETASTMQGQLPDSREAVVSTGSWQWSATALNFVQGRLLPRLKAGF